MKLQDMPRSHSSAGFFVKQRRRGMALQFMPRSHSSAGVFIGGREHGKALQYLPRSPSSATRFKQTETMEEHCSACMTLPQTQDFSQRRWCRGPAELTHLLHVHVATRRRHLVRRVRQHKLAVALLHQCASKAGRLLMCSSAIR